jgi:hypothetical protein
MIAKTRWSVTGFPGAFSRANIEPKLRLTAAKVNSAMIAIPSSVEAERLRMNAGVPLAATPNIEARYAPKNASPAIGNCTGRSKDRVTHKTRHPSTADR